MATRHRERVSAVVFIAPNIPVAPGHRARVAANETFLESLDVNEGWQMWNRSFWLEHYPELLRFFFSQCFTEPDSAEQIQHFWDMGMQTTPEVLLATSGDGSNDLSPDLSRAYAAGISCPSLVIHGDGDAITPLARGRELARLSGAQLVVLPGSGHEPHCRAPARTNQVISQFLDTCEARRVKGVG